MKSFENYKKAKGKEWKKKVSKSDSEKKKKVENVIIHIGLMEWSDKEQKLKGKRGKKIPLRVPSDISHNVLLDEAKQKWKNFHSDLYDESQLYHLLYEDGQEAVFIPGSKSEEFTLSRYHEEIGKDFKRITLFLCTDMDFLQSEGFLDDEVNLDDETWFDPPVSPDHGTESKDESSVKRPRVDNPVAIDLTTDTCTMSTQEAPQQVNETDQLQLDIQLANQLQHIYDIDAKQANDLPLSASDVVKLLAAKVDSNKQSFIVVRRNAQLDRVLSIWIREAKRVPVFCTVRLKFIGEQGIDSGAMAKEFFTITLAHIRSVMFPGGSPVDSTFHVQNGNFKACGEIAAASLAQGGPSPCFLDESVYCLMVNPDVSLQELDPDKHLTESDRVLMENIRQDVKASTDTIIEHGYTGVIENSRVDEIVQSIMVSIVTKRLVYLKEFMNGLNAYGLQDVIRSHPDACKVLFIPGKQDHDSAVDANYLFSTLCPHYSEAGTTRKKIEESIMDFFQDFLFTLEDKPCTNSSGYTEALVMDEGCDSSSNVTSVEGQVLFPDCSPAGVMGWLTGQKHKPIDGETIIVNVMFDHDCLSRNPNHRICFPVVGACAKEVTLPVSHMKTSETFNEVFMLAMSKGQAFSKA